MSMHLAAWMVCIVITIASRALTRTAVCVGMLTDGHIVPMSVVGISNGLIIPSNAVGVGRGHTENSVAAH